MNLGEPIDQLLDDFYVSDWGFKTVLEDEPDWIKFNNQSIAGGLMFDFKPTSANADTLLDMYIELTDLNESDP